VAGVAFVGIGSNIDAYRNCIEGIRSILRNEGARFLALSSLYRTSPVSPIPQDDFLNCVLKIAWSGSPRDLLETLLSVEQKQGRRRDVPLGPRTLDLDILLFGDALLNDPDLVIPHPRLHMRRFTLVPCLEIDPGLIHPRLGLPLASFLPGIDEEQHLDLFGKIAGEAILPGLQTS
jgi:2-amino-4-hydroxy-6-hydroxymethyldihydropteridine diphosphokinase